MKLGISYTFTHNSPEEWALKHKAAGLEAVVFPCKHTEEIGKIDAYVQSARDQGLVIAEVGSWCNTLGVDPKKREAMIQYCIRQLELAEYIGAKCSVNVAGTPNAIWDGGYANNYDIATYEKIVETIQRIIDAVKPARAKYTLEPMPHMHPYSPEDYAQMIADINRFGFAVHMDIVNMLNTPQLHFQNQAFITKCFDLLGRHTVSCHIKDQAFVQSNLTVHMPEAECGEGDVAISHYIKEAEKYDADMPMIIEHLKSEDAFLRAIAYVKQITAVPEK